MARSVVHAIADPIAEPIVRNAPRVALAAATAPVRAVRAARRVSRAELVDEDDTETTRAPALSSRYARVAEPLDEEAEPIRVAYMVPRPTPPTPPRPDPIDRDDDDQPSQLERDEDDSDREPSRMGNGDRPMVNGSRAVLRNGIAYAPSRAPQAVKNAIWAANTLRRKPYIWGGGHGSFYDRGYDCSGTVSFALHGAGALGAPLPSNELTRFGERGRGRWFTIYSRPGHTFAVIAGLRLDTTDFLNGGNTGPRWHDDMRDTRGYVARHPAGM